MCATLHRYGNAAHQSSSNLGRILCMLLALLSLQSHSSTCCDTHFVCVPFVSFCLKFLSTFVCHKGSKGS
ncbi:hypothetical protein M758_2G066200 [Ceratodon purpureus]|nr:hypothetical protein M758_2G066200 [Ceratodon purpureus]